MSEKPITVITSEGGSVTGIQTFVFKPQFTGFVVNGKKIYAAKRKYTDLQYVKNIANMKLRVERTKKK